VEFRHRPETGTPLKNKIRGERPVGIPDRVARILSEYVGQYRYDSHDDSGRQPLLCEFEGRAGEATIRAWSYRATIPCLYGTCPHGKDPDTCDWVDYHQASKCPSSRSPHQIRNGLDHVAVEHRNPAGGGRRARERLGEDDRGPLRLGFGEAAVAALPRSDGESQ